MAARASSSAASSPRARSRPVAFGLLAVGALAGLIVAAQPWWTLTYTGGTVTLTGTEATAGLPQALAAVLGAGTLLGLTLRVIGRRILAAVLLAVSAAMAVLAVAAPRPGAELVTATLQRTTLEVAAEVARTAWSYGFAGAAAAGLAGALIMLLRAGRWPSRGTDRFTPEHAAGAATAPDSPAPHSPAPHSTAPEASDPDDQLAVWKALDAGDDPTGRPGAG